jgi:hypothetical protein
MQHRSGESSHWSDIQMKQLDSPSFKSMCIALPGAWLVAVHKIFAWCKIIKIKCSFWVTSSDPCFDIYLPTMKRQGTRYDEGAVDGGGRVSQIIIITKVRGSTPPSDETDVDTLGLFPVACQRTKRCSCYQSMGQNFCGLWWDQDCELKEIPISGISTGYVRSH